MRRARTPVKAIREYCRNCSETEKRVAWCPCDGLHSNWCPLWLYRFGIRPETASQKYGKYVVTPEMMPGADVSIDDLPANPADWSPIARQPIMQGDSMACPQAPAFRVDSGAHSEATGSVLSSGGHGDHV